MRFLGKNTFTTQKCQSSPEIQKKLFTAVTQLYAAVIIVKEMVCGESEQNSSQSKESDSEIFVSVNTLIHIYPHTHTHTPSYTYTYTHIHIKILNLVSKDLILS